jgi:molybdopterin converting factor small subunit
MLTVRIPTSMRVLTEGRDEVEVEGATVGAALADLDRRHPGVHGRVFDDAGMRRFVAIFVDQDDVRYLDGLYTPLHGREQITILQAVAGG